MRTSRLVFTEPNLCTVETVELDEAIGPHEVVVRNRLGLISAGTELAIFTRSHRGFDVPEHWAGYPYWPGYCNVGEVVAAGDRVAELAIGDRVKHEGTHATYSRQQASTVLKVPDELPDERAVFLKMLGIASTPQLVAPVTYGECVVVVGLGVVGNLAAQCSTVNGAHDVRGIDRSPGRRAIAHACGIATCEPDELTEPPQYVIEAVGLGATVRDAIRMTAPRGRTILLSSPREAVELDPYFDIHHPARQVIGAHESARSPVERRPLHPHLCDLLATGRVRVDPLVTQRIAFGAGAQDAYEGLRDDPDHWTAVLFDYEAGG